MGKIGRVFSLRILKIFFGQFGHPIGGNGMRERGSMGVIDILASLLENMKIWCNIQIIIYCESKGTKM